MTATASAPAPTREFGETVLEAKGVVMRFGGLTAVNGVDLERPRGRDRRPHRPQRCRQDDLLQLPDRPLQADRGRGDVQGFNSAAEAAEGRAGGDGAHVPNIRLFSDGAGERHGRAVLPHLGRRSSPRSSAVPSSAVRRPRPGRAQELLDYVGLGKSSEYLARNMPYGDQRRLEIARALAADPQLLLLDEPTAGMNPQETRQAMDLIFKIRDGGIAVVVIERHAVHLHALRPGALPGSWRDPGQGRRARSSPTRASSRPTSAPATRTTRRPPRSSASWSSTSASPPSIPAAAKPCRPHDAAAHRGEEARRPPCSGPRPAGVYGKIEAVGVGFSVGEGGSSMSAPVQRTTTYASPGCSAPAAAASASRASRSTAPPRTTSSRSVSPTPPRAGGSFPA